MVIADPPSALCGDEAERSSVASQPFALCQLLRLAMPLAFGTRVSPRF